MTAVRGKINVQGGLESGGGREEQGRSCCKFKGRWAAGPSLHWTAAAAAAAAAAAVRSNNDSKITLGDFGRVLSTPGRWAAGPSPHDTQQQQQQQQQQEIRLAQLTSNIDSDP